MTSTVKITCQVDTSDASTPLGIEAWIDDLKFFSTDHLQGPQELSIEVDDDTEFEHILRIMLYGKRQEHTCIDADGNIVSDARITIKDVAFDEIKLGHMFTKLAVYTHNFNGTGVETQQPFYDEMGCNGTLELKFTTPIYLWLLEHM
jgi:hypothetical protein